MPHVMPMSASFIRVIVASLALALIGPAFAGDGPELDADLQTAKITIALPTDRIAVEDTLPLTIVVSPHAGHPAPMTIRARLGMPDHGHWVTEEQSYPFQDNTELEFQGEFPMHGLYRFRVWLDYADGEVKTAVDFTVGSEAGLGAHVVE